MRYLYASSLFILTLFVVSCGDNIKGKVSRPDSATAETDANKTKDPVTPPQQNPADQPLTPSKLGWDGTTLVGTSTFVIVPMD